MGIRNRILRREPGPENPVADDATTELAHVDAGEHAPQGDPLAAPAPATATAEHPTLADAEHEPQGDPLTGPASEPSEVPPPDVAAEAVIAPMPAPRRAGFRERGRMRRRMRFLREARELGFRDLGGLVFDQHRFQRPNEGLVAGKVAAIDGVDRELRAIEDVLGARRAYDELFVAGVSACPRCGALHGSDARFCPNCGLDFAGPRPVAGVWTDGSAAAAQATGPGQSALFDPQAGQNPPAA